MSRRDIGSKANKWVYNSPCCGDTMAIAQAGSPVTLRASGSHLQRLAGFVQESRDVNRVEGQVHLDF